MDAAALKRLATPAVQTWLCQLAGYAEEKRRNGNTMASRITDADFQSFKQAHVQRAVFLKALVEFLS